MSIEQFQTIAQNASTAFRACWWAEPEELKSAAIVALLSAQEKGQLEGKEEGQIFYIARRHAGNHLRAMSSPVHITWRQRKQLGQYQRAPLEELPAIDARETERHLWHVAVRERLSSHAMPEAVQRVLLWQETPAEVAEELKIDVASLYNQIRSARRKLARDQKLGALWKDRP